MMRANLPKKDVNKTSKSIFEETREKRKIETIRYIKKLPLIYEEISFKKIRSKTGIDLKNLENLIEEMIFNEEINGRIKDNVLFFTRIKPIEVTCKYCGKTILHKDQELCEYCGNRIID
jgi:DNA-directed RNA polymerase subunit RPC12/RpoP